MIFHVVAIKEISEKNYTIVDVLCFGLSEEKVREILHTYKLITLELYPYEKEKVNEFGKIRVVISFDGQDVELLSNTTDVEGLAYGLSIIGFDIKDINYIDSRKLSEQAVNKVLVSAKNDAKQRIDQQKALKEEQERNEEQAFNDEKLQKTLLLVDSLLRKIPQFIKKASNLLPKDKLKELSNQGQELAKLKMGRNVEMLSSLLGRTYNNYNELEQEFLTAQSNSNTDNTGADASSVFVTSEIQKLEKAKNLMKIGKTTKGRDVLYASLGNFVLYFKLIKKDLVSEFKKFRENPSVIFDYLLFGLELILVMSSIYFVVCDVIKSITINEYVYVMFIGFGVLGFMLFLLNHIKKKGILANVFIFALWFGMSILSIILLKQNFIF